MEFSLLFAPWPLPNGGSGEMTPLEIEMTPLEIEMTPLDMGCRPTIAPGGTRDRCMGF
jgi:hypothetical protein